MKRIRAIVTALLMLFTVAISAQQETSVTINGEALETQVVKITFDGDNVVLHFTDGTQLTADMQSVVLLFTKNSETTIQVLKQPVSDAFSLDGLPIGTPVCVYDAQGRLVLSTVTPRFSVMSLHSGTYLLKAGSHIVKFVKR